LCRVTRTPWVPSALGSIAGCCDGGIQFFVHLSLVLDVKVGDNLHFVLFSYRDSNLMSKLPWRNFLSWRQT
jgi:hypothetical protein